MRMANRKDGMHHFEYNGELAEVVRLVCGRISTLLLPKGVLDVKDISRTPGNKDVYPLVLERYASATGFFIAIALARELEK